MSYIIYKTTNLVNQKIYVGQHNTSADDGYLGSGLLLERAIEKYGVENFKRSTIEFCTSFNVNEKEIYWIDKLNATNPEIGYNLAKGGNGGFTTNWNEEQRKEISQRMKNWWDNISFEDKENHRNKVSLKKSGKKMSNEGKKVRKNSCIKWWETHEEELSYRKYKYSGKGNPNHKYFYRIFQNEKLIEETYNIRDFCERNSFPLSYVKQCIRTNGKYKDFLITRTGDKL